MSDEQDIVECTFCQAEVGADAKKCRHCGEWLSRTCEGCGTQLKGEWAARGFCVECQRSRYPVPVPEYQPVVSKKSRGLAAFLAFFFGTFGFHRFYLGNILAGLVYILFSWTLIPTIAGVVGAIKLALMDDRDFHARYG